MPYVGVVLAGVQIFFLTMNNFIASPFQVLAGTGAGGVLHLATRADGSGLNPLLQYPEMVIHPPTLYSGYTGFTIPFAFALAALLGRYPGEKWIHLTRRWTMIAWAFSPREFCSARTGRMPCSDGAATGAGIRSKMLR